jgi:hypothetical protein
MRRIVALTAGWLGATIVAIAVAWQGVGFVGREVTGQRPAALSAGEVQAQLGATTTSTTVADPASPRGASPDAAPLSTTPTTVTRSGKPVTTPATSATGGPPTTVRGSGGQAGLGPRPDDHEPPPPTSTTTVQSASAETRTYNTIGGTAVIRFEPGKVSVVSANPKAGFDYQPEQSSPSELRVRFRSDTHESRIDAKWEGGPVDSVEEKAQ